MHFTYSIMVGKIRHNDIRRHDENRDARVNIYNKNKIESNLSDKGNKNQQKTQIDYYKTIRKRLIPIKQKVKLIKEINDLIKTCSACGVYHEKNLQERKDNWEKLNTPKWEREIITDGFEVNKELAHSSLKQLEAILIDIQTEGIL